MRLNFFIIHHTGSLNSPDGEMVDTTDSKSVAFSVEVRILFRAETFEKE